MEKSKAPTFSRQTIDYSEFKRGGNKVADIHWYTQIKYKVNGETCRIISPCNTMAKVWEVLDSEFVQEQWIVNDVDLEINNLVTLDCSLSEYIVKLGNYLPNLEEALRSVSGLGQEKNGPK